MDARELHDWRKQMGRAQNDKLGEQYNLNRGNSLSFIAERRWYLRAIAHCEAGG
jgi:hypothetical protein